MRLKLYEWETPMRFLTTLEAAWGLWTMSATATVWDGRFLDVSVKTPEGWRYIVDHASMLTPAVGE